MFLYDYICLKDPTVNSHPKKYLIHILTLHLFGKNTTEVHWASSSSLYLLKGIVMLGLLQCNFMVTTRPPVVGPKGWKLWNLKEWTL